MKTITKVITYCFFKPIHPSASHHYIRVTTETNNDVQWVMGYENHIGLVSCIGGNIQDELKVELEKEYQEKIKENDNN